LVLNSVRDEAGLLIGGDFQGEMEANAVCGAGRAFLTQRALRREGKRVPDRIDWRGVG
jgi:hypothetical protein